MRSQHDRLAVENLRQDDVDVVRQEALHNVLQALRAWHLWEERVTHVVGLGVLVVGVDFWWRSVVGTAPAHKLLFTVLLTDLGLVQALQLAVVTLIEAPVTHNWNPVTVRSVQRDVRGADRTTQQRREHDVRQHALFCHQLTGVDGFLLTLLSQIDIDPAGELVGLVPFTLSVTDKNQLSIRHGTNHATNRMIFL